MLVKLIQVDLILYQFVLHYYEWGRVKILHCCSLPGVGGSVGGSVQSMVSHWGESPLSVTRGDTAGWIAPGGLIVKESNLDAPLEKREGSSFCRFHPFCFSSPSCQIQLTQFILWHNLHYFSQLPPPLCIYIERAFYFTTKL